MAKKAQKAKKRPAPKKKSSPSKPKKTAAVVRIKYRCQVTCKATPKFAHMAPGDVVVMDAVNTDVTLTFVTSPFRSGVTRIDIPSGGSRSEEVKSNAAGRFPYALSCSHCPTVHIPPEMIVL